MRPVADHAIIRLDVWPHIRGEILDELFHLTFKCTVARRTEAKRPCVTHRHHDDHRLGFARGDQVVEDEAGTADGAPGRIAIERAVQKVKDRILPSPFS